MTLLATRIGHCAAAEPTTRPAAEPLPGVTYVHETQGDPAVSLHIVRVDLTNPRLSLHVAPGGPNPDTTGHWQTKLLPIPSLAAREGFDLAINGDFFSSENAVTAGADAGNLDALVKRGYWTGAPARVSGSAVTDGHQWATGPAAMPGLLVGADGRVWIEEFAKAPAGVVQAITGNRYLIKAGVPEVSHETDRNARTAIGLDRDRRVLTIVVVDGLVEGKASGITMPDLKKELARLGCYDAINLDGGGSSTLVMRETEGGKLRVLNHPTDGKPRAVANGLGVKVSGAAKK